MSMQVKELGHLVLYVRNLDRSRRFYRDLLGWKEITVQGKELGFPAAAFSSGRTHHELLLIEVGEDAAPIPRTRRVGLYHFASRSARPTTSYGMRATSWWPPARAWLAPPITASPTFFFSSRRRHTRSSCTSMCSRPSGRTIRRRCSRNPDPCVSRGGKWVGA